MLYETDTLPEGMLDCSASHLYKILPGPSLIRLKGRREPPLFISVLLHGNETTGWIAVQRLLQRYAHVELPRSLVVFIGNVEAARWGVRRLEGQPDFNRIWKGEGTPEHEVVRSVLNRMKMDGVFASVDVHNNTGRNPHYACINRMGQRFFHLAMLFSRTVVFFTRPEGVQTSAFADLCPAVTVECGIAGEKSGVQHAEEFLDACLHLAEIPSHPVVPQDISLFHTLATVKIPESISLGIGDEAAEIQLAATLDKFNFSELVPQTLLGRVRGEAAHLQAFDNDGKEIGSALFDYSGGLLRNRVKIIPSMFTLNTRVIRQDCLGYLMERLPLEASPNY